MAFDYKGKTFRVKIDTKEIMHEIEFNYGATTEFQDLASKDVENEVHAGKSTYSLSANGYADNSDGDAQEDVASLFAWRDAKSKKAFQIADSTSGNLTISGDAYCESVEITSNNDEVVTYSLTLRVINSTYGTTA